MRDGVLSLTPRVMKHGGIDMIKRRILVTVFLFACTVDAPAAAASGSYDYVGQPIDCVGVQSSCTVKVAVPGHFTASMTLPIDFNHTLTGDQTFYAFAFNVHGITDWSISDGTHVLGSTTGDLLDPNSYLTYNNGVIRTWGIAASIRAGRYSLTSRRMPITPRLTARPRSDAA